MILMKALSQVENRDDFTLDLLSWLRKEGVFGGRHGAPDELLLHSGGPQSDLSKRSLLMGPATCRYIVRQPPLESHSVMGSPLCGEIDIQSNPSPMQAANPASQWSGLHWREARSMVSMVSFREL